MKRRQKFTQDFAAIGEQFGLLKYDGWIGVEERGGRSKARFKCKCGNFYKASVTDVLHGKVKSCGCILKTSELHPRYIDGRRSSITYSSWTAMRSRCNNNLPGYEDCTYDPRWESFDVFLKEMNERPSIEHQLDKDIKIKGNRHYNKDACSWVLRIDNMNARSNSLKQTCE
jgi:hypothetical protein